MLDLKDVANIEGDADSAESYFTSIQKAINSLDAWKFLTTTATEFHPGLKLSPAPKDHAHTWSKPTAKTGPRRWKRSKLKFIWGRRWPSLV